MVYADFNQTAVQIKVGITFAAALRHILRQDPDVIMVGEIRDDETAQYAIQAALTGHLVFSTLHTNDAASSISRLVDLGVERFLISSTLIGAMAQRLVRKICPHCVTERHLEADEISTLRLAVPPGKRVKVKEGEGCFECRNTGYLGRSGIFEIMPIDDGIKNLDRLRRRRPRDQARSRQERHAHPAPVRPAQARRGDHHLRGGGAGDGVVGIPTPPPPPP